MHGLDDDDNKRVENRRGRTQLCVISEKRCGHVKNQRGTHALYYSITDYVIIELYCLERVYVSES